MDEVQPGYAAPSAPPEGVGETLRAARERLGLSLAEIASRTRVPLRHLEAIEDNDYSGLPSPTYAVGFVKAYARAVGVDEIALSRRVRGEVAQLGRRTPDYQPYEATDPSRVPSRGLAIVTLGLALAVIVLLGLWFGTDLFRNRTAATPVTSTETIAAAPAAPADGAPAPVASPTPAAVTPSGGQVTLTTTDRVWLRVHDADNKTLYIGTMAPGERFDVPGDAKEPMVDVGRPDKLQVTLNGSVIPPLAASSRAVTNLKIGAAALQARLSGGPAATPTADAPPPPSSTPSPTTARAGARPRSRPALTETQRANLDSARHPPPPGNL